MKKLLIILLILLAFCLLPLSASAIPISFIHEGSGSGELDGQSFANTSFTITAYGDTDNVLDCGWAYYIDHASASMKIDGLGTLDFITGTRTFVNYNNYTVGFSREGGSGLDLFNGPVDMSAFSGWDMTASIGPISGSGFLTQWDPSSYGQVMTDMGLLFFNTGSSSVTFEAIVDAHAPEPTTLLLLGSGLFGLAGFRRKLKK